MMIGLVFAVVGAAVGADRLTNIASIPVLNEDAWIGYVGSIDPSGGNADWDWGSCEGDVRCFVDDMTAPRVQSDGSESWGSWGWGFCAPPQVNPFSAYHSPRGDRLWSEVRLTYADSYPFRRFLRFDLEHGTSNNHPESTTSGQVFGYVLAD